MRHHSVPAFLVALATALTFAAAPRPARSQSVGGWGLPFVGATVGLITIGSGLLADVIIPISLANTGWVPRGAAIMGGVAWSLTTAAAVVVLIDQLQRGVDAQEMLTATVFSSASLGLSFYGLFHGPPSSKPAVTLAPTAIPTGHGQLVPALSLSGRF